MKELSQRQFMRELTASRLELLEYPLRIQPIDNPTWSVPLKLTHDYKPLYRFSLQQAQIRLDQQQKGACPYARPGTI